MSSRTSHYPGSHKVPYLFLPSYTGSLTILVPSWLFCWTPHPVSHSLLCDLIPHPSAQNFLKNLYCFHQLVAMQTFWYVCCSSAHCTLIFLTTHLCSLPLPHAQSFQLHPKRVSSSQCSLGQLCIVVHLSKLIRPTEIPIAVTNLWGLGASSTYLVHFHGRSGELAPSPFTHTHSLLA